MTRPYISLSIAQLEFLAAEDPTDTSSVGLLIDELRHRHGRRVRRLLCRLEASVDIESNRPTPAEKEAVVPSTHGPMSSSSGGVAAVPSDESLCATTEDYELLLRKYEDLRLTFTVEAEILARWGMTPCMPRFMQEQTFAEWRKQLLQAPDTLGRSVHTLDSDLLRILDERRLLQKRTTPKETQVKSKRQHDTTT
jgi:hypothetical protein